MVLELNKDLWIKNEGLAADGHASEERHMQGHPRGSQNM